MFFIIAPTQIQISAQNSEETVQATQTREVTIRRVYGLNASIPKTISYNTGGWRGTLYKTRQQSTGDHILATFQGTVTCTGTCAIPSQLISGQQE